MTRHWVLAILFTAQGVLPIGGGLCLCEDTVAVAVAVPDCRCGCDPAAGHECCCYDAEKQPADHTKATLSAVQQTVPHLFVLIETLSQPNVVSQVAVALDRTITPCDFFICLTRAERAPPA